MRNSAGRVNRLWTGVWGMPDQRIAYTFPLWFCTHPLMTDADSDLQFELFLLLSVCWNPSSDRIFKAPDVVGGPIINSSELGWAAIGQSAMWGKHCQGGVPLVQGRLSTTPLPNTPSRLPTNTPHPPKWNVVCLPHSWTWISMTRRVGEPD